MRLQKVKFFKIVKYLCLCFGSAILVYVMYSLNNQGDYDIEPTKIDQKKPSTFSLTVNKPIFEGSNSSDRYYKISAQKIAKNAANHYLLNDINGEYFLSPESKVKIFSRDGEFDDDKKMLHLLSDAKIIFNDIRLKGYDVYINIDTQSFYSNQPIIVQYNDSKIRANQISSNDNAETTELRGDVETLIYINDL